MENNFQSSDTAKNIEIEELFFRQWLHCFWRSHQGIETQTKFVLLKQPVEIVQFLQLPFYQQELSSSMFKDIKRLVKKLKSFSNSLKN